MNALTRGSQPPRSEALKTADFDIEWRALIADGSGGGTPLDEWFNHYQRLGRMHLALELISSNLSS